MSQQSKVASRNMVCGNHWLLLHLFVVLGSDVFIELGRWRFYPPNNAHPRQHLMKACQLAQGYNIMSGSDNCEGQTWVGDLGNLESMYWCNQRPKSDNVTYLRRCFDTGNHWIAEKCSEGTGESFMGCTMPSTSNISNIDDAAVVVLCSGPAGRTVVSERCPTNDTRFTAKTLCPACPRGMYQERCKVQSTDKVVLWISSTQTGSIFLNDMELGQLNAASQTAFDLVGKLRLGSNTLAARFVQGSPQGSPAWLQAQLLGSHGELLMGTQDPNWRVWGSQMYDPQGWKSPHFQSHWPSRVVKEEQVFNNQVPVNDSSAPWIGYRYEHPRTFFRYSFDYDPIPAVDSPGCNTCDPCPPGKIRAGCGDSDPGACADILLSCPALVAPSTNKNVTVISVSWTSPLAANVTVCATCISSSVGSGFQSIGAAEVGVVGHSEEAGTFSGSAMGQFGGQCTFTSWPASEEGQNCSQAVNATDVAFTSGASAACTTHVATTAFPTSSPTSRSPTWNPTAVPSAAPSTGFPTSAPNTLEPTVVGGSLSPSSWPSFHPTLSPSVFSYFCPVLNSSSHQKLRNLCTDADEVTYLDGFLFSEVVLPRLQTTKSFKISDAAEVISVSCPLLDNVDNFVAKDLDKLNTLNLPSLAAVNTTVSLEHLFRLAGRLQFPRLELLGSEFRLLYTRVSNLSLPLLRRGSLEIVKCSLLRSVDVPLLKEGSITMDTNDDFLDLSVPSLTMGSLRIENNKLLKVLRFPALQNATWVRVTNNNALIEVDFPMLQNVNSLKFSLNKALIKLAFPQLMDAESLWFEGSRYLGVRYSDDDLPVSLSLPKLKSASEVRFSSIRVATFSAPRLRTITYNLEARYRVILPYLFLPSLIFARRLTLYAETHLDLPALSHCSLFTVKTKKNVSVPSLNFTFQAFIDFGNFLDLSSLGTSDWNVRISSFNATAVHLPALRTAGALTVQFDQELQEIGLPLLTKASSISIEAGTANTSLNRLVLPALRNIKNQFTFKGGFQVAAPLLELGTRIYGNTDMCQGPFLGYTDLGLYCQTFNITQVVSQTDRVAVDIVPFLPHLTPHISQSQTVDAAPVAVCSMHVATQAKYQLFRRRSWDIADASDPDVHEGAITLVNFTKAQVQFLPQARVTLSADFPAAALASEMYIFCSVLQQKKFPGTFAKVFTAGFLAAPRITSPTLTGLTVSFQLGWQETVMCALTSTNHSSSVSNHSSLFGSDSSWLDEGTVVAERWWLPQKVWEVTSLQQSQGFDSKPLSSVPSAARMRSFEWQVTGLWPNGRFKVFCRIGANSSSSPVTAFTAGFKQQPEFSSVRDSTATWSIIPTMDSEIRCALFRLSLLQQAAVVLQQHESVLADWLEYGSVPFTDKDTGWVPVTAMIRKEMSAVNLKTDTRYVLMCMLRQVRSSLKLASKPVPIETLPYIMSVQQIQQQQVFLSTQDRAVSVITITVITTYSLLLTGVLSVLARVLVWYVRHRKDAAALRFAASKGSRSIFMMLSGNVCLCCFRILSMVVMSTNPALLRLLLGIAPPEHNTLHSATTSAIASYGLFYTVSNCIYFTLFAKITLTFWGSVRMEMTNLAEVRKRTRPVVLASAIAFLLSSLIWYIVFSARTGAADLIETGYRQTVIWVCTCIFVLSHLLLSFCFIFMFFHVSKLQRKKKNTVLQKRRCCTLSRSSAFLSVLFLLQSFMWLPAQTLWQFELTFHVLSAFAIVVMSASYQKNILALLNFKPHVSQKPKQGSNSVELRDFAPGSPKAKPSHHRYRSKHSYSQFPASRSHGHADQQGSQDSVCNPADSQPVSDNARVSDFVDVTVGLLKSRIAELEQQNELLQDQLRVAGAGSRSRAPPMVPS